MIFFILVGIPIALFFISLFAGSYIQYGGKRHLDWGGGFINLGVSAFIALIVGGATIPILTYAIPWETSNTDMTSTNLRAISTETTTEGHFYFLGTGVINGDRQISYITSQDGYSQIATVDVDHARIFEDEETNPHVDIYSFYLDFWWIAPWLTHADVWYDSYDFHIPEGSVVDGYNIDISK